MSHLTFRTADSADYQLVAQLHALSWRTAYQGILTNDFLDLASDADRLVVWRARLANHSATRCVYLAVEESQLIGFVCVCLNEDERWGALLDNLHIHPERKGRGVGRQLMGQAVSWVLEQQPQSTLYLWVYEENRSARGFYDHLGGVAAERVLHPAPDGHDVPTLRYIWKDLAELRERCASSAKS